MTLSNSPPGPDCLLLTTRDWRTTTPSFVDSPGPDSFETEWSTRLTTVSFLLSPSGSCFTFRRRTKCPIGRPHRVSPPSGRTLFLLSSLHRLGTDVIPGVRTERSLLLLRTNSPTVSQILQYDVKTRKVIDLILEHLDFLQPRGVDPYSSRLSPPSLRSLPKVQRQNYPVPNLKGNGKSQRRNRSKEYDY